MSAKTRREIYSEVTKIQDYQTGETKSLERKKHYKLSKEPKYVKVYLETISQLNGLPHYVEATLRGILKNMTVENIFIAAKINKTSISNEEGISIKSIDASISLLKRKGILVPIADNKGAYFVDNKLFARGSWEYIEEIRVEVKIDKDGKREISSDLPDKLKKISEKYGYQNL